MPGNGVVKRASSRPDAAYGERPTADATSRAELNQPLSLTAAPAPVNRVVQGRVTDPSGNPVSGAVVKIFTTAYTPVAHTLTNPSGQYVFNQLASTTNDRGQ